MELMEDNCIHVEDYFELTPEVQKEITDFLSKKRRDVIYELDKNGKLTHGDLAKAVESSRASLSNILIKFEQFPHKLLDSMNSGKFRYYFLTELGKAYARRCLKGDGGEDGGNEYDKVIQHQVLRCLQEAKECLAEFRSVHGEDWEIRLDDAFIARMNYCRVLKEKSELLVDRFLENIEKIMLSMEDALIDKTVRLLAGSNILQGRLVRFMDRFEPFCFLLKELEEGKNTLKIYDILEAFIEGNPVSAEEASEEIGWPSEEYEKLAAAISELADHMEGQNEQDIYECFCRYLAGNRELSAYLARAVKRRLHA